MSAATFSLRFRVLSSLSSPASPLCTDAPSGLSDADSTPKDSLRAELAAPHSGRPADSPISQEPGNAPDATLAAWFEPLDVRRDGNDLHIVFPHAFFPAWFEQQGKTALERAARRLWEDIRFHYAVRGSSPDAGFPAAPMVSLIQPATDEKNPAPLFPSMAVADLQGQPGHGPGFDAFLCGSKNQFTLNVLRETAGGEALYNPLFLRGASGTGKTHLLRAWASAVAGRFSDLPGDTLYLAAPDFAALFRGTEREKDDIRSLLRTCPALCVDDVHLLTGQPDAQAELASLLDVLIAARHPVLCSAVLEPDARTGGTPASAAMTELSPALLSRLCMGIVLELTEPDLDVRLRYAQAKLAEHGLETGRDTPLLLARRCTRLRHMQGAILRMRAFQSQTGRLPDESDMDTILRSSGNPAALTPEAVVALVAGRCGYTSKDLRSRKRDPKLVRARQIAMYLCRELLGESYPALGRLFGGKDHSTVMHAVKKIRETQVGNKDMHILVTELTQSCRKHLP